MSKCPHCQSELLVGLVSHQQQVRCARCGTISLPQIEQGTGQPNRAARWSLWLGVSSILLLWITGIPALILGIRALWQMRYNKPTEREKKSAIIGTVLGTTFGVVLGGCVTGFLGIFIMIFMTLSPEMSDDPDVIRQWLDEVVQLDIPQELEPHFARKSMPSRSFSFYSGSSVYADDSQGFSNTSLQIIYIGALISNNPTVLRTLQDDWERTDKTTYSEQESVNSEQLQWNLDGTTTKVDHETFLVPGDPILQSPELSNFKADHYIAFTRKGDVVVGLQLSSEGPGRMSQDQVRQLFESLDIIQD
ncbi:MAG: DUF4190 domain-containing protein [Mariniblastus sp.]|nr:DUF4190 domain-containing protein [Mariniblastus sp.]